MGKRAKQYLSLREIKSLFRAIKSPRDYCLFFIAYRHGLRVSEVCQMKMSDIDVNTRRIKCVRLKGSVTGLQMMDDKELDVLRRWLLMRDSKTRWLFPGSRGGFLSRKTVDKKIKEYSARAKIPASKRHFHILKHSIAVHLLEAGAEIKLVQELLGHRNIQNTLIYAELVSKYRDEKQLEMFGSDKVF